MKKIIFSILFASLALIQYNDGVASESRKVCVNKITKDGKQVLDKSGKPIKICKQMKVHKKLEGTKVPDKNNKK